MRTILLLALLPFILASVVACAKPDSINTFKSSDPDVFYTVETFNGHGAAASDFTRIYAHLVSNGKTDRSLVLDGDYLVIGKITWINSKEVDICLSDGITNTFRNQVTLVAGGRSETIGNHLQQQCVVDKMR